MKISNAVIFPYQVISGDESFNNFNILSLCETSQIFLITFTLLDDQSKNASTKKEETMTCDCTDLLGCYCLFCLCVHCLHQAKAVDKIRTSAKKTDFQPNLQRGCRVHFLF